MARDTRTRALIADPATKAFRPSGLMLYLAAAVPFVMALMGYGFWATDDGSGDPLGMKFILGSATLFLAMGLGFLWFARRHAQTCLWIGPNGLYDSRVMTRALDWSEVTAARRVEYTIGNYDAEAIALTTAVLEEIARAGPRLRAFNRAFAGMPDLPIQISGLSGGQQPILDAFRAYAPQAVSPFAQT